MSKATNSPQPISQPMIYWRVVGVALATAALFIITTIFALKAWSDGKRSAAAAPVRGQEKIVSDVIPEPESKPSREQKQQPAKQTEEFQNRPMYPERPAPEPILPPAKPEERKTEVASVPVTNNPTAPAAEKFKRLDFRSEEDLRKELVQVPIFHKNQVPKESLRLLAAASKEKTFTPETRPDFAGLPMRMGVDCQLGKEPAENLHALSQKLRANMTATIQQGGGDPRPNAEALRKLLLQDSSNVAAAPIGFLFAAIQQRQNGSDWLQPEAVPTLVQMLMAENKPIRLLLVEMLARNPSRESGVALAQRALFDLSPDVREAAVQTLKTRPRDQIQSTLVDGFRHPWSPVNDHAAEALVALNAKETIGDLVKLLDQPAPAAALMEKSDKKMQVREMVRINHLSSCTFCHPRSLEATDLVRGQVPDPNQRVSPGAYQQERPLSFVRADVTYLRQDFSVTQPVTNPGPWPAFQRFDYVVRVRPLTLDEEIFERRNDAAVSRQRQALLFALRELVGNFVGDNAVDWRRQLAEVEKPAPSGFN